MKKITAISLVLCFVFFVSNSAIAQSKKGNPNKEEANKEKTIDKEQSKEKTNKEKAIDEEQAKGKQQKNKEDSVSKGKGNAYGKNKDELKGKEFGQDRAEQAKLIKQQRLMDLDSSIVKSEQKMKQAKEKIKKSKEKLEKEKNEGTITEEDYKMKKKKIEKAEVGLKELEEKIKKGKEIKL